MSDHRPGASAPNEQASALVARNRAVADLLARIDAETVTAGPDGQRSTPPRGRLTAFVLEHPGVAFGTIATAALVAEEANARAGGAERLVGLLAPSGPFAVLCDAAGLDGLEYAPGDLLPVAVWHRDDLEAPWRRVPLLDAYLASYLEALTEWLEAPADVRGSPTTVAAEASLAEASGLAVVPATTVPDAIAAARPFVEAVTARARREARSLERPDA